ncbi:hypothetical protein [Acidovorax sp. sic0104]|uniref:hypothetical protein n=1 Tax=Acidovorax sp. sic0104 TaxID=2854784 RepID=UPI001C44B498|nr:hypothetical protein [Acidovorax sp. sic0104]MBV7542870.1 hypothetical protein [Acidovorax sp. sic0104]
MLSLSTFFDAFWPNLAATLIGVVLGVPIALFLNERGMHRQRRLQVADMLRQTESAIDVLIDACKYNARLLDTVAAEAQVGRVMHRPDLRITTWDAIGSIFSTGKPDATLLQFLSHHWLRLQRVQSLCDEIFAREVARSLPAFEDDGLTMAFWENLYFNARDLSAHATQGVAMLEKAKEELKTEHAA